MPNGEGVHPANESNPYCETEMMLQYGKLLALRYANAKAPHHVTAGASC